MSNMAICGSCGRTMDSSFMFCPWCGTSKISGKDTTSVDAFYDNISDKKHLEREQHIEELGNKLDNLERELSVLVLSAEMHK